MSELKPCPFCGCTAIYVTHTHYYDDEDTVCVFCNGCKSVVMLESNEAEGINDKTRAEAIEAWNTRSAGTCEVVVDHGKSPIDGKTIILHRCSACYGFMRPIMNYCPNCGAKVVGE